MIALYRKELRTVWPLGLLCFLFMSGDLLYRPFTERLDERAWEDIASYVEPGEPSGFAFILGILTVFLAYSAFPREHDERTIELLYALPLRRRSIFLAKALAGLTVLFAALVGLLLSDGAQSAFDTRSFSGGHWRADIALTFLALEMAFGAIVYAHAMLASVLRLFGLIPYVLLLFVAAMFEDHFAPAVWMDPAELLVARYEGTTLLVPWAPLLTHSAVGALALALSYALWMGPADRIGRALERLRASLVGKAVTGCVGAVVVGFVGLMILVTLVSPDELDVDEDSAVGSIETRETRSERYTFTYPVSHEARARALIASSDDLHDAVRERLGADPGPVLVADLTEVSSEHLGIASWTHLRVGLVGERDPVRLKRTFAHETAHAFQHRLSDRRQADAGRATRFFAEGSAEWVAFSVVPSEATRSHSRSMAAAAWERHAMTSLDLIDDDRLRARFDTTLVYPLGEIWTAALVDTCGAASLGDALRAMARPDAPRDLGPRAFWEDTLRAVGCDYEAVDAAFLGAMARAIQAHRAAIDALPRIGGGVVGRDGLYAQLVARLDRDGPASAVYVVSVRPTPDATDTQVFSLPGQVDPTDARRVVFRVPRAVLPGARFQIRFWVLPDPAGWAFSETWQWASAP